MAKSELCCLHPDCLAIDCPEPVCTLDVEHKSSLAVKARDNETEARRLYAEGWTLTSIALRLGVAERTVYNYLAMVAR